MSPIGPRRSNALPDWLPKNLAITRLLAVEVASSLAASLIAWHWQSTDRWYYTLPGIKKRVPLFDVDGKRIRGIDNKKAANLALARVKLSHGWRPEAPPASPDDWLVAKTCSEYLQYCERGVANGSVSKGHRDTTKSMLNDLCKFCGALPVT